jgi:TolB-like protein/DNA-binding winged helix-turn-helix (wHTH) protein
MTPGRLRFGPFTFDPASGELWHDGRRVPLQRQPSRLLALLTERAGEVVSRDEIRQALWGNDTYVDFERSLNFCVGKLRSALGDNATAPRYVETIPTRGYRFMAAAKHTEYPEHAEYAEHAERKSYVGRVFRPGIVRWAVIAAILLAGAWLAVGLPKILAPAPPKIVVVPFHNETGLPDFDRLAKGVSDAAVARLAAPDRLPRLRVIGNATDVFFSFKPHDMKAMGNALGAKFLLLGQVKKDDRHVRVIAHLIRVDDQTHVWATTFDRDSLDLATQSAIADEIAKAVTSRINPS